MLSETQELPASCPTIPGVRLFLPMVMSSLSKYHFHVQGRKNNRGKTKRVSWE